MMRQSLKRLVKQLSANDYQTLNRIEISRSRVLANIDLLRKQQPIQTIIPVLKANAYGHGLTQIATILNDADCALIAVDGYFEAAQIKDLSRHQILVMGHILSTNVRLLDTRRCSFVVQDVAGLHAFGKLDRPISVHMELNTGMYRMGLSTDEVDKFLAVLKQYRKLQLEGIMTHLADADNAESTSFTDQQVALYEQMVKRVRAAGFDPKFLHVAQTAGSVKVESKLANAIRVGIGLYGINPLAVHDPQYKLLGGLRPVMQLKSTIIKTHNLKKGERVSYNGIFTAAHDMKIGILPLGYYEGLPRELSVDGYVSVGNQQLPIVGRICMNHTMIDLTDTEFDINDEVTVISNDNGLPNSIMAATVSHQLFSYGWLAHLSASVKRLVVN